MIGGHFATALVAKQQSPAGPLAFYLAISQLPDFLWHALHFLGVEPTSPANPMLVSLDNMQVDMTYSHDLLPTILWIVLATLAGRGLFGDWRTGITAGVLVLAHLFCDAISGHAHFIFGPESPTIGLGLYASAPYLALGIEAVFTACMMGWVFATDAKNGVRRSRATLGVWAAVFGGGTLMMAPSAALSMTELTGLAPVDALTGFFVPGVVALYATIFAALLWADAQPTATQDSGGLSGASATQQGA